MTSRFILAASLLALPALGTDDGQLTPREMFYSRSDAPPAPPTPASTPAASAKPKQRARAAKPAANTVQSPEGNLGLRYTVVRVTTSGSVDASDGDVFHAGDCVQLKVESNSTGYLYVLHHGPDGNWQPLMPSPKMPDESNRIEAFKEVQIPAKYCFRFDNNPGMETLFLAVAASEGAMPQLRNAILSGNDGPAMMALNINHQVDALRGRGMDIMQVERVVETPKDANQAHAVYVVNASDTPNDRVVAEIRLRHE